MSDNVPLSDMIRNLSNVGRVARVHWADSPEKSNPGVGFSRFNGGLASCFIGGLALAAPGGGDAASFPAINRDRICSCRRRDAPAAVVHSGSDRISRARRRYSANGRGGGGTRTWRRPPSRLRGSAVRRSKSAAAEEGARSPSRPNPKSASKAIRVTTRQAIGNRPSGKGRANGVLGFGRATPPALVKPKRQRRPRGAGNVERRPQHGNGLLEPPAARRCAAHDRADPILNGNQRLDESAVLLPGRSRGKLLLALPADDPRSPVAQAKAGMEPCATVWTAIQQEAAMRGADAALRQHPIRPQMLVAPGGAIGLEAGAADRRRPREPSAPRAGPGSRTRTFGRPGRRRASVKRDARSGSTPQACAQDAMSSRGGAASSIGMSRARRLPRPRRGRRPSRQRRVHSGRRPARARTRAVRRDRGAARPEGAPHHPAARSAAFPARRPAVCVIDTSGRMRSSPKL